MPIRTIYINPRLTPKNCRKNSKSFDHPFIKKLSQPPLMSCNKVFIYVTRVSCDYSYLSMFKVWKSTPAC